MFTFIDLFAGIGGIRLGFEAIGGKCVFTSEIDKFAQQTYRANFPNDDHAIAGDIRAVDVTDIPPHDVLLGGFPCQAFSQAGVTIRNHLGIPHGFGDQTKGTLFFEIVRIIQHHKPKAFMLENVKNLVNHDKGNTFKIILDTLKGLGYTVSWRVIDGSAWVPQRRKRIYLVGFRDGTCFDFGSVAVPKEHHKLGSILDASVDPKYTLTDKSWQGLQAHKARHKAAGHGLGYVLADLEKPSPTLVARYYKDGAQILIPQAGKNPRKLTPRECARLMGFDYGSRQLIIPVSDSQAYKQLGNAVVVPAVQAIAEAMKPLLISCQRNSESEVSYAA